MIAECLVDWELLAPYLELTEADEKAISKGYRDSFELQKREALRKWKRKCGSKATYSLLVQILCKKGCVDLAEKVKEVLTATECSSSPCKTIVATIQKHLKDCYTKFIGKTLRSTSVITALHLGVNWHPSVTNVGNAFKHLIEGLARNYSCVFLSLASTNLKPCHTHYLVLLITFCKSLDCFSLDRNPHLRDSIPLLASALKYNNNLTIFGVSFCGIKDQQLLALAQGLQHSKSMRQLDIWNNLYSINAAVDLVRCLTSSSIIQLLMDRDLITCHELQEALRLTNMERSRRGSLCLTLKPVEILKDSITTQMEYIIPGLVPERLLRQK